MPLLDGDDDALGGNILGTHGAPLAGGAPRSARGAGRGPVAANLKIFSGTSKYFTHSASPARCGRSWGAGAGVCHPRAARAGCRPRRRGWSRPRSTASGLAPSPAATRPRTPACSRHRTGASVCHLGPSEQRRRPQLPRL